MTKEGFDEFTFDFEPFELDELYEIAVMDMWKDVDAENLEAGEDDFDATPPEMPKTVLGDLYEIGEHRLLCGDSTNSDLVAKLMNGEKADMVFTDPPYDMQMKGGCVGEVMKNMIKVEKDIDFISKFNPIDFLNTLPIVFESKKMNSYIFCNKDLVPKYLNYAVENKYSFNILVWKKPNAIPLGDSHHPDIEYLILLRKSAIWNNGLKDVSYSRCLEYSRESGLHPTMKPIELILNEIKISSNAGSLIFDFFLGSGSTMVASHQLKRKCYGMELDEKYCDVIVRRMIKLDSELTVKRNGIDVTDEFKD
jgi:DNA modification methylase